MFPDPPVLPVSTLLLLAPYFCEKVLGRNPLLMARNVFEDVSQIGSENGLQLARQGRPGLGRAVVWCKSWCELTGGQEHSRHSIAPLQCPDFTGLSLGVSPV